MPKGCSSRRSASDSRLTAALLALYAPYDPHQVRCTNAKKWDSEKLTMCAFACADRTGCTVVLGARASEEGGEGVELQFTRQQAQWTHRNFISTGH